MSSESTTVPAFIVTGASRGIGDAIIQELMRRGARVLGVAPKSGCIVRTAAGGNLRKSALPAGGRDGRSRSHHDGRNSEAPVWPDRRGDQ
jgi:NAD(P)-dependent dehydrogenase (short-subunit alcohol dehydrogenase family)